MPSSVETGTDRCNAGHSKLGGLKLLWMRWFGVIKWRTEGELEHCPNKMRTIFELDNYYFGWPSRTFIKNIKKNIINHNTQRNATNPTKKNCPFRDSEMWPRAKCPNWKFYFFRFHSLPPALNHFPCAKWTVLACRQRKGTGGKYMENRANP